MNEQEQIKKYIASHPVPKRSEMQALDSIIREIIPGCKLWFLDIRFNNFITTKNGRIIANDEHSVIK